MQVQRRVSAEEALGGFVKLARSSRLTADEHDQFALWAEALKSEIELGRKVAQELEQLRAEHGKCPKQPSGADTPSGAVASEGNGPQLGEGPALMGEGS